MLSKEERNYLRRHSARLLATLSLVRSFSIKSVLDVGSGTGSLLHLLPPAWRTVGVDSPANAELAKKRGVDIVGLDLENEDLPFESNTFELVTLLEVIEHVRDKRHVLREIYRVLTQDGRLLLTTPDVSVAVWWLRDRILDLPLIGKLVFRLRTGRVPDRRDSHKGCLNENELTDLLQSEGFVVAARGRFTIFQPNDDIVLVASARKVTARRKVGLEGGSDANLHKFSR
jgi:SAM-dependent methyltransferase